MQSNLIVPPVEIRTKQTPNTSSAFLMSITTTASTTETEQTIENFLFHLTMPGVILADLLLY